MQKIHDFIFHNFNENISARYNLHEFLLQVGI